MVTWFMCDVEMGGMLGNAFGAGDIVAVWRNTGNKSGTRSRQRLPTSTCRPVHEQTSSHICITQLHLLATGGLSTAAAAALTSMQRPDPLSTLSDAAGAWRACQSARAASARAMVAAFSAQHQLRIRKCRMYISICWSCGCNSVLFAGAASVGARRAGARAGAAGAGPWQRRFCIQWLLLLIIFIFALILKSGLFFLQVRLAQARGARVRVRGPPPQGDGSGMAAVFLQLDGEPWKQDAPSKEGDFLEVRATLSVRVFRRSEYIGAF